MRGTTPLPSAGAVLANATYLHGMFDVPALNYVYRTLGVEVQFYIVFALLMLLADTLGPSLGRLRARVLVFGATSLVALLWPLGWSRPGLAGRLCAVLVQLRGRRAGLLGLAARRPGRGRRLALASRSASRVRGRLGFRADRRADGAALLAAGRFGRMQHVARLGLAAVPRRISYSLYLLHNPLTGAGFNLVRRVLPAGIATELVGLCASVAICIAVAYPAYRLVEVPSQRWSRAIRLKRPARLQREFA